MQRIKTLSLITLLMTQSVYAGLNFQPQHLMANSYLTFKAGVMQANVDQRYNDLTDIIPQNIAESVQQSSYVGVVGIGTSFFDCGRCGLSAELSFGFLNKQYARFASGAASTAFVDKLRIRYFGDLVLIPSIVTGVLDRFYLKAGYSVANIYDKVVTPVGTVPNPVLTTYTKTRYRGGVTLGLGYERKVTKQLGLYAEYLYYDYHHVGLPQFTNFTANYSHSARITSNAFILAGANFYLFA